MMEEKEGEAKLSMQVRMAPVPSRRARAVDVQVN